MALPHVPNHQQQTRPKKTHQQWKRHELLECSIQSQQVRRSTGAWMWCSIFFLNIYRQVYALHLLLMQLCPSFLFSICQSYIFSLVLSSSSENLSMAYAFFLNFCFSSVISVHPPPTFGSSPNLEVLAFQANKYNVEDGDSAVNSASLLSR